MNLLQNLKMPGVFGDNVIADETAKPGPKGRPSLGPQRYKTVSAGQQRRAQARFVATARRKTNLRYRRSWMQNERAFAALRGQLQVVGLLPYTVDVAEDLILNVEVELEKRYGSLREALAHYETLVAERTRR